MKSLKLSKEDAFVHGKWKQLIRGTEEDSGKEFSRVLKFHIISISALFTLKQYLTIVQQ